MEETGRGREEPMKAFISYFELMDKHVTEVNSGHLAYTLTRDNDLFSWTVYTLKNQNRGTKNGSLS